MEYELIDTSSKQQRQQQAPPPFGGQQPGAKRNLLSTDPRQDNEIDQDDAWHVIKAYFKQHGLVSQQISSFNRFINICL
jgi:DNA-directed RNA polymerase beta subunit